MATKVSFEARDYLIFRLVARPVAKIYHTRVLPARYPFAAVPTVSNS